MGENGAHRKGWIALAVLLSILLPPLLVFIGAGDGLDRAAFDRLLKGTKNESAENHLADFALVGIDDKSLRTLNTPLIFYQEHFATLINGLYAVKAKGVVFDVIPAVSLERLAPRIDAAFVSSMRDASTGGTPVYLGFKAGDIGGQMPHQKFIFAAGGLAYVNIFPDSDGKVRRHNLWARGKDGDAVLSLPLAAALLTNGGTDFSSKSICAKPGLCDDKGEPVPLVIDYRIDQNALKVHSLSDVLELATDREFMGREFGGKVIFVGPMTERIPDSHKAPLNLVDPKSTHLMGLRIQAQAALTALSNTRLVEMEKPAATALAFVGAVIIAVLMYYLAPVWAAAAIAGAAVSAVALVVYAFKGFYVVPATPLVFSIFLPPIIIKGYQYSAQYSQFRVLKRYFGSYVSEEVMKEILNDPQGVNFDGSHVVTTIMFTDIRGFTTISESLPAPVVTKGLNRYLEVMTGVIIAEGGYVNRYLGDGILALFGAPNKLPHDGALSAVKAGLAMRVALDELNREVLFPGVEKLKIGIGVHTGDAIVGNVGCFEKMDYTVIGDAANLASRIEGLTKQYQTAMLISGSTLERIKEKAVAKYVDTVTVKGRSEGTPVYSVESVQ